MILGSPLSTVGTHAHINVGQGYYTKAVVTTTIRLRFDGRSTASHNTSQDHCDVTHQCPLTR